LSSGAHSVSQHVPPIFVSHGSPALALDEARGSELAQWARGLPRPRGILVISAHWQAASISRGSTSSHPKLLFDIDAHDALGVGDDIRSVGYAAPGAPDLAYELATLLPIERAGDR